MTPLEARAWLNLAVFDTLGPLIRAPVVEALMPVGILRDYQLDLLRRAAHAMALGYRRILLVLPTGGGKTVLASAMMASALAQRDRSQFIVHRKELIDQTSDTFTEQGLIHGFVASGRPMAGEQDLITLAGVQTLVRRLDVILPPRFAIVDESHHATAASWANVLDYYGERDCFILGLTATPERLDGKGLDEHFDIMIVGPSTADLIEAEWLSPFDYYAPGVPDLSGIHTTAGDFNRGEIDELMNEPKLIGDIVSHYQRLAAGEQGIVFAASRAHSKSIVEAFLREGVEAAHVDGTMSAEARRDIVMAHRRGDIAVMSNVDLFGEGFDVPAVSYVGLARPTKSLALHLQQCLDLETEVLTKRGWLTCNDISQSDLVAAFDTAKDVVQYVPIERIVDRPLGAAEKMFGITSPHLDIRVTGGHTMIVKGSSSTCVNWQREAADLLPARRSLFRLPVAATLEKREAPISDAEIRLIGWFLTDGTRNSRHNQVTISQASSKPEHCAEIRRTISECGIKYGEHHIKRTGALSHCCDLTQFTISHGKPRGRDKHLSGYESIAEWFDKSMGPIFDSLSRRQLGVLLSAMNLGDGKNMNLPTEWKQQTYTLAMGDNEQAADRLQALCVTRGFRCNKSVYRKGERGPWWTLLIKDVPVSTIAGSNDTDGAIQGKKYRRSRFAELVSLPGERVWCLENRLGTLITRRNGKVAILGNCGRGLRISPGKERAIICDHAGNAFRHGLPDEPRDWSLQGRKGRAASSNPNSDAAPVHQCETCFRVTPSSVKVCPGCDTPFPVKKQSDPKQEQGELAKLERVERARKRKIEERACRTYEDFLQLAITRGYQKPQGWARIRMSMKARGGRR